MSRTAILDSIEKKVSRLMADNRRLRDDHGKLSASRERMREENQQLTAKVAELERKLTIMELREGFADETVDNKSSKAARARVNRLMREVDKCIALLNRSAQ